MAAVGNIPLGSAGNANRFNVRRSVIYIFPFLLLAAWHFHFSRVYFWFPTHFASRYHPGWTCSTISIPGGGMCEDIVDWKERGLAILTCDSNRRNWNTVLGPLNDPNPKGQLVLIDYKLDKPTAEVLSLGIPPGFDFHPLGAALFHQSGHSTLFSTNAGRNGSTIELFHVSHSNPPKLTWKRSISHELIPNANAILPVSPTQFYVTNDHHFRRAANQYAHIFESYSQLPFAHTTFVDISEVNAVAQIAMSQQRIANGITATPDLETVFIAETAAGAIGAYSRTPDDKLQFKEYIKMEGLLDNIHFNDDGYLDGDNWGNSCVTAGAHLNMIHLIKQARGTGYAPSLIVSARPAKIRSKERQPDRGLSQSKDYKETWHVQTELQDDGKWFSGATGAFIDTQRGVMIGVGLYDSNGAFICRRN